MKLDNLSLDSSPRPLNLPTMFRLGLFQMGLGMMSVLTLGILNRIMINELRIPALVTAAAIAVHQFMAPARVWFGQQSDARPFLGHHRTGYVWVGAAIFSATSFVAVQVMWQLGSSLQSQGWTLTTQAWTVLLAGVFAVYGLALSASSTPFAALLVDVSDEDERPRLVGIVWSMLLVGVIAGAIGSGALLKRLGVNAPIAEVRAAVNQLFVIMPAIVAVLAVVATIGVEKTYSSYRQRSLTVNREDSITLGRALQILTASPQTMLFFNFLLLMTLSLFMQEPVMEPYGAEVFRMTLSETTQINAFWGMGTLVGLSTSGFLIVPRLGKYQTARLGCVLVASSFGLILLSGVTGNPQLFRLALVLFGLASGVTTTGAISLMLDLTAAETAGTFIGAWGLSQAMARGLAVVVGGGLLSLGEKIFPVSPLYPYFLVFGVQAAGMVGAIALLGMVNVQEFKTSTQKAIHQIMEMDLD